jgi:hypothetical protein
MAEKKESDQKQLKAFAPFEFRGGKYKEGDSFTPPADLIADAQMEEFRRVNTKRGEAKGRVYYYEVPPGQRGDDPDIRRVVLPVE